MSVGLTVTLANSMLAKMVADGYVWVQLHVGDPGAAGTSNPAVNTVRKQATWSVPAAAAMETTAVMVWTAVPATEVYTHYSLWTLSAGGVCGHTGTVAAGSVTVGSDWTVPAGAFDVTFPVAS